MPQWRRLRDAIEWWWYEERGRYAVILFFWFLVACALWGFAIVLVDATRS